MHVGIKPWLLGFENWAVPTSPVIHIGPFPMSNPDKRTVAPLTPAERYRLYNKSGAGPTCLGFLVSCFILGGESMMERNKAMIINKFGRFINVEAYWTRAMETGKEEKLWLDSRRIMSFEDLLQKKPWEVRTL